MNGQERYYSFNPFTKISRRISFSKLTLTKETSSYKWYSLSMFFTWDAGDIRSVREPAQSLEVRNTLPQFPSPARGPVSRDIGTILDAQGAFVSLDNRPGYRFARRRDTDRFISHNLIRLCLANKRPKFDSVLFI